MRSNLTRARHGSHYLSRHRLEGPERAPFPAMSSIAIPASRTSPWAALPVVLAGTFMVVLDFFIVNVAMPAMQSELHASAGAIEWVVAGYGLTFATLLITAGRLGDQLGRRRMFSTGLILFTVASAACGLSTTPEMLIVARAFQGAAAALLSTNVPSIIGVTYTGPDRLRALSIYGTVLGLAAVGGQLIGGALVEAVGWRSIFLINVPIGVVALALSLQQGRGLGALQAGLVFTILAISYMAASVKATALTTKLGRGAPALVPALLLIGAGMGMVITPLTT